MRTSCPLRWERNTSSDGTARPLDCSSSDRSLPRSELPGHIGTAEGILHHGIIGSADLERAFACAHVQAGLAVQFAFEDQLADEFQLGLRGVRAHASSYSL